MIIEFVAVGNDEYQAEKLTMAEALKKGAGVRPSNWSLMVKIPEKGLHVEDVIVEGPPEADWKTFGHVGDRLYFNDGRRISEEEFLRLRDG